MYVIMLSAANKKNTASAALFNKFDHV